MNAQTIEIGTLNFDKKAEDRIREIVREEVYGHEQRIRQLEAQLAQFAAEVSFLIANDKKTQPLNK